MTSSFLPYYQSMDVTQWHQVRFNQASLRYVKVSVSTSESSIVFTNYSENSLLRTSRSPNVFPTLYCTFIVKGVIVPSLFRVPPSVQNYQMLPMMITIPHTCCDFERRKVQCKQLPKAKLHIETNRQGQLRQLLANIKNLRTIGRLNSGSVNGNMIVQI